MNNVKTFHMTHSHAPCSRHLCKLTPNYYTETNSSNGLTNRPPTRNTPNLCCALSRSVGALSSTDNAVFAARKFLRRRISERRAVSEMIRYRDMPELKAINPVAKYPFHRSRKRDIYVLTEEKMRLLYSRFDIFTYCSGLDFLNNVNYHNKAKNISIRSNQQFFDA